MKIKKIVLYILLALFSSCTNMEIVGNEAEIQAIWKNFISELEKKDREKFRDLSSETITCYPCLENTEEEIQSIDKLRDTDSSWYDSIYTKKIYVPISKFVQEDYNLIFNDEFIEVLKSSDTKFLKNTNEKIDTYEVLVTTTPPNKITGFEGAQHGFTFERLDSKYKLTMISTIP